MKLARYLTCGVVLALCLELIFVLDGCVSTSVLPDSSQVDSVAKPRQILLYDFAVSPEEATYVEGIDFSLKNLFDSAPRTGEEIAIGHQAAEALSKHLLEEIHALGIPVVPGTTNSIVNSETLQIKGQFLSVSKGGPTNQDIIGLGVGSTEVRTATQIYGVMGGHRKLVHEFDIGVQSRHGQSVTKAAASDGHLAVSAIFSSDLAVGSAAFSETMDANAARTAKVIGNQLKDFFQSQGWTKK